MSYFLGFFLMAMIATYFLSKADSLKQMIYCLLAVFAAMVGMAQCVVIWFVSFLLSGV